MSGTRPVLFRYFACVWNTSGWCFKSTKPRSLTGAPKGRAIWTVAVALLRCCFLPHACCLVPRIVCLFYYLLPNACCLFAYLTCTAIEEHSHFWTTHRPNAEITAENYSFRDCTLLVCILLSFPTKINRRGMI